MLNAETVHATLASRNCTLALSLASALAASLASIREFAIISGFLPRSNGRPDLEAEGASDEMTAWPCAGRDGSAGGHTGQGTATDGAKYQSGRTQASLQVGGWVSVGACVSE